MPRNAATNRFAIRDYNAALSAGVCRNSSVGLDVNTSGASVAFWYYPITADGLVAASFEDGANASVFRINIETSTRRLFTWTTTGGVGRAHKPSYTIELNRWHRVVFTYANVDGSNRRSTIYVDGVSIGTETSAGLADTSSRFSCSTGATSRWISDVRVFNAELTLEQVQSDYYDNKNLVAPVISWPLTEGAGLVANDVSGNGWNGTISSLGWTSNTPSKGRVPINGNKVKNGDFEYAPPFTAATTTASRYIDGSAGGSTTNDLFGWAIESNGSAGSLSAQFDTSTPLSGTCSIKLSTTATASAISVRSIRNSSTTADILKYGIPVTPNTTYNVSFAMRTNLVSGAATSGAFLRINHFNAVGSSVTSTDSTKVQTTTAKTTYQFQLTTGSATTLLIPNMQVVGNDGAATLIMDAWFDDISLTPVYPEGRVPANGNLVKNFDFEVAPTFVAATITGARWINGTAAGSATNSTYKWALFSVTGTGNAQFDTSVSFSGAASLKLSTTATASLVEVCNYPASTAANAIAFGVPVVPNTSYTYSFRIKTSLISGSATTGAQFQIIQRDAANSSLGTVNVGNVVTTQDWTVYTNTFTTSATTTFIQLRLRVVGNDGAGTLIMDAWFDDIYLAKTTNPGRVAIT